MVNETTFDPWPGTLPARRAAAEIVAQPLYWPMLYPRTRARIAAVAVQVLADHPEETVTHLVQFLYERLRCDQAVVEDIHCSRFPNAHAVLQPVVQKLLSAGSVRATLLAFRAEVDEQLAALDRVRGEPDSSIATALQARAEKDHAQLALGAAR